MRGRSCLKWFIGFSLWGCATRPKPVEVPLGNIQGVVIKFTDRVGNSWEIPIEKCIAEQCVVIELEDFNRLLSAFAREKLKR